MTDPQARRSLPLAPRAERGLRHLPLAPEARDGDRKFHPNNVHAVDAPDARHDSGVLVVGQDAKPSPRIAASQPLACDLQFTRLEVEGHVGGSV